VSQRNLGTDLRVPTAFGDVYRVQVASGWQRTNQDSFARIDGGVTAVFPRSVYVATKKGAMPEIAPGTIFYLGHVPGDEYNAFGRGWGTEGAVPGSTWSDTHFETRVLGDNPLNYHTQPATENTVSIMNNEGFRRTIVRALLLEAAQSSR
jgi:hypothetical protein